jgi:hypothetical protein
MKLLCSNGINETMQQGIESSPSTAAKIRALGHALVLYPKIEQALKHFLRSLIKPVN